MHLVLGDAVWGCVRNFSKHRGDSYAREYLLVVSEVRVVRGLEAQEALAQVPQTLELGERLLEGPDAALPEGPGELAGRRAARGRRFDRGVSRSPPRGPRACGHNSVRTACPRCRSRRPQRRRISQRRSFMIVRRDAVVRRGKHAVAPVWASQSCSAQERENTRGLTRGLKDDGDGVALDHGSNLLDD